MLISRVSCLFLYAVCHRGVKKSWDTVQRRIGMVWMQNCINDIGGNIVCCKAVRFCISLNVLVPLRTPEFPVQAMQTLSSEMKVWFNLLWAYVPSEWSWRYRLKAVKLHWVVLRSCKCNNHKIYSGGGQEGLYSLPLISHLAIIEVTTKLESIVCL